MSEVSEVKENERQKEKKRSVGCNEWLMEQLDKIAA
jgi:hypothetical protein